MTQNPVEDTGTAAAPDPDARLRAVGERIDEAREAARDLEADGVIEPEEPEEATEMKG